MREEMVARSVSSSYADLPATRLDDRPARTVPRLVKLMALIVLALGAWGVVWVAISRLASAFL
jgi:hypothetical protein